jgi:hypothetical protein
MEPVTRRSFLRTSSAGAVGVASAAAFGPVLAPGGLFDHRDNDWSDEGARFDDFAVLTVRNARDGEIELLVGNRSIVFKDRGLVSRISRATR